MNYKNKMLKYNFDFLKQVLYNLTLSSCIAIITAFIVVHFSNSAICVVLSNSMEPEILENDILVIHKQRSYQVGDVIQFDDNSTGLNITHRILAIKNDNLEVVFICKGDYEKLDYWQEENGAVQDSWKGESEMLDSFSLDFIQENFGGFLQIVSYPQIRGKVVEKLDILSALRSSIIKIFQ